MRDCCRRSGRYAASMNENQDNGPLAGERFERRLERMHLSPVVANALVVEFYDPDSVPLLLENHAARVLMRLVRHEPEGRPSLRGRSRRRFGIAGKSLCDHWLSSCRSCHARAFIGSSPTQFYARVYLCWTAQICRGELS
jgi:hypothetical protein